MFLNKPKLVHRFDWEEVSWDPYALNNEKHLDTLHKSTVTESQFPSSLSIMPDLTNQPAPFKRIGSLETADAGLTYLLIEWV